MSAPVCPLEFHEMLKGDPGLWALMPYKGWTPAIPANASGPAEPALEHRDCRACGSTLARPIQGAAPTTSAPDAETLCAICQPDPCTCPKRGA
jgi:hypothetical protein